MINMKECFSISNLLTYFWRYLSGMKCKDKLRVIFNQWQKLHLGLDVPSNQKILKGIYCTGIVTFICPSAELTWVSTQGWSLICFCSRYRKVKDHLQVGTKVNSASGAPRAQSVWPKPDETPITPQQAAVLTPYGAQKLM